MSPRIQVPTYTEKGTLPGTAGGAKISPADAALPYEAEARAFQGVANLAAQVDEQLTNAENAAKASKAVSDASLAVGQLHQQYKQSPAYLQDPESTQTVFQNDIQTIGKQAREGLPPSAQRYFDEHFNKLSSHYALEYGTDVRNSRVNIIRGSNLKALDNYSNAISTAPSDDLVHENMKGIYATLAGGVNAGAYTPERAEELKQHYVRAALLGRANHSLLAKGDIDSTYNAIRNGEGIWKDLNEHDRSEAVDRFERRMTADEKRAEEARVKQANTQAMDYLQRQYNLNDPVLAKPGEAYREVMDPDKARALGLTTLEQRLHVGNAIITQASHARTVEDEQQKRTDKDGFMNVIQGKWGIDKVLGSNMSADEMKKSIEWINKDKKDQEKTDYGTWNEAYNAIMNDEDYDLSGKAGNGLSKEDVLTFTRMQETRNDPEKSKWFKAVDKMYDDRYKNETVIGADAYQEKKNLFMTGLLQRLERDKIRGYGITSEALKMFQDHDQVMGLTKPATPGLGAKGKVPAPPKTVGVEKGTGKPVMQNDDGSYYTTNQTPQLVGTRKSDGAPVYKLLNGDLVVGQTEYPADSPQDSERFYKPLEGDNATKGRFSIRE